MDVASTHNDPSRTLVGHFHAHYQRSHRIARLWIHAEDIERFPENQYYFTMLFDSENPQKS
jgi:hypothetical protein